MNPLANYPEVRKYLYLAQFIIAGVILLIGVGFAAASMDFPTWYVVTSAVASALWSYLGLQAAANTTTSAETTTTAYIPDHRRDDHGRVDGSLIAAITAAITAVVVLALFGVFPGNGC